MDERVDEREAVRIPLNPPQNGDKVENVCPPVEIKQKDTSSSIRLPPIDRGYAWIIFLGTVLLYFIIVH